MKDKLLLHFSLGVGATCAGIWCVAAWLNIPNADLLGLFISTAIMFLLTGSLFYWLMKF